MSNFSVRRLCGHYFNVQQFHFPRYCKIIRYYKKSSVFGKARDFLIFNW